jgi:AraC-like DNA-binding protein
MTNYNQTITKLTGLLYHNGDQTVRAIRARKFIDHNFNRPIPLDKIANAVYCSKFHLNREFKRHYGITPSQYLKGKRILEAKKLLSDNSSVTDTCYSVGYDSLSTFSMLFRQWTGFSPSNFKKARMNK